MNKAYIKLAFNIISFIFLIFVLIFILFYNHITLFASIVVIGILAFVGWNIVEYIIDIHNELDDNGF